MNSFSAKKYYQKKTTMKKLLFLLLVTLTYNFANGQNEQGEFNEKLELSLSKENAYTNTLIWIAESFNDSNNAIKIKDKEAGIIVVKGIVKEDEFSTSFTMTFRFSETECSVNIKDWEETQFHYTYGNSSNCYTKSCRKNIEKWTVLVNELSSKLLKEINHEINE